MTFSLPEIVRVDSTRRQRTLARRVDVAGFGFWTSRDVVFSFLPADDDSGVRFFRVDLPNSAPIPALVANRIRKPRQTSLVVGDAQVDMIEHVLAALRGAGIDNCDVLVDAPEAPGLDGSGSAFLEAFLEAGAVEQTRERTRLKVVFPGRFGDDSAYIDVLPSALEADDSNENADSNASSESAEKSVYDFGSPCYEYRLVYDVPRSIPNQMARFDFTPETFRREIAPARTFLTLEEANYLREQGICGRVGPR
ncbi:MAG: UDP-3-O-acyl-N-acetylglucosamine deacetylase, partial [Thermoguttaceae bacterium]|nr:UDP-3-O-acyl-N-acetylglucosamine deacetylase [Thermoguttaceae bacterium]